MHELGITARIVEVAVARAAAAGTARITDVHLEIGAESGVAPESIELYWPQVSRATSAEGASLHFKPADDPWACRVVAIDVADGADEGTGPDTLQVRSATRGRPSGSRADESGTRPGTPRARPAPRP